MRVRGLLTLLIGLLLTVGCTHDSDIDTSSASSVGRVTTVKISATLPDFGGVTRGYDSSNGGTRNIDWNTYELRVIVKAYGDNSESEDQKFRGRLAAEVVDYIQSANSDGSISIDLDLPLTSGHTYDVYLWADYVLKSNPTADLHYDTSRFPTITLTSDALVINDESRDAFFARNTAAVGDGAAVWSERFNIERAVAKLRMVATDAESATATKATLQMDTFYGGFNIATAEAINKATGAVVSDKTAFETYSTESAPDTKSFITAYMLWPASADASIMANFYEEGKEDAVSEIAPTNAIPLKRGNLTTLRGEMFESGWDGKTTVEPMTIDGDWLVLNNAKELAWVLKTGNTKEKNKIRITSDMDMGGHAVNPFPVHVSDFDGNNKSITNIVVNGNSLFTIDKALSIHDLNVDTITVGDAETVGHVGVLLDEVKLADGDSVTYSNVTISNASVSTTNGAAGGLIGYIGRADEKNRDVTYTVTIENCELTDVTAAGSLSEGHLVGLFSGYDSGETLIFKDNNTIANANTRVIDYVSHYTSAQQSCWLAAVDDKYDGMLGDEVYHRGTVYFGDQLFVPKWDGETKVEPLTEDGALSIYSPFDLAYLQKGSHSSVTFKSDVDLGGSYTKSKNKFNPIRTITNLDGQGHTLYDLYVDMVHDGTGAAFIQTASGTTTHKNITFERAYIKNVHNAKIPTPAYGVTNDGGAGNAYAGTLVSHTGGDYTAENVHFKNGKVYAVCKMGGAIGYVGSTNFKMKDCSVDKYVVENYEPGVPNYYTLPDPGYMDIYLKQFQDNWAINLGLKLLGIYKVPEYGRVSLLQWWYTNGECGGLIGFVKAQYATIDNCSVTNTDINCIGQPNKTAVANVWDKNDYNTSNPYQSDVPIFAKGSTDIAGRHVNQFIGDVVSARASESGTNYVVTISNYTVSGNRYKGVSANSTNEYNHNYAKNKYCEVVGCAYYVGVDVGLGSITLKHVNDYAGELTFYSLNNESNKVTLIEESGKGNNMDWTGGSFSDMEYKQERNGSTYVYKTKSEYPTYP